jgi:hypothetical protein
MKSTAELVENASRILGINEFTAPPVTIRTKFWQVVNALPKANPTAESATYQPELAVQIPLEPIVIQPGTTSRSDGSLLKEAKAIGTDYPFRLFTGSIRHGDIVLTMPLCEGALEHDDLVDFGISYLGKRDTFVPAQLDQFVIADLALTQSPDDEFARRLKETGSGVILYIDDWRDAQPFKDDDMIVPKAGGGEYSYLGALLVRRSESDEKIYDVTPAVPFLGEPEAVRRETRREATLDEVRAAASQNLVLVSLDSSNRSFYIS